MTMKFYLRLLQTFPFTPSRYRSVLKRSISTMWRPLEKADSIRVLEVVSAATEGSLMECKLHHTTVDNQEQPYIAISYAWGASLPSQWKEINCDGHKYLITPNLHSALTRANEKLADRFRFYWVDALCIDQSLDRDGLTERALQVQMMDKIFNRAKLVLVDLGEITSEDIEMLNRLSSTFGKLSEEDWKGVLVSSPRDGIDSDIQHLKLPTLEEDTFWIRLAAFVSRPYFTRVWIIQEIVLARHSMIMVGRNLREIEILDKLILRAITYFWRLFDHFELLGNVTGVSKVATITSMMSEARFTVTGLIHLGAIRYRAKNIYDFATLLMVTRSYNASDIRDKAFALRGLAKDDDIKQLYVSYEESPDDCARRVSKYLVNQGKGTWLLYNCCGASAPVPSWTYDLNPISSLSKVNELSQHVIASGAPSRPEFRASGETQLHLKPSVQEDYLAVSGYVIDSVLATTSPMPLMTLDPSIDVKRNLSIMLHKWFKEVSSWASKYRSMENSLLEDFEYRCWRTIATDRYRQGTATPRIREAPSNFLSSIDAFIKFVQSPWYEGESIETPRECVDFLRSLILGVEKRLAISKSHAILCLLPNQAEPGDHIAIFEGCIIPFCLRKAQDSYRIVGPCYIDGMMDGEVLTSDKHHLTDIVLC